MTPVILVLNAGSSSVKFSVFRVAGAELHHLFRGGFEALGAAPHLSVKDESGTTVANRRFDNTEVATQEDAVHGVLSWLQDHSEGLDLVAVGHRVVHGGPVYAEPVLITPNVLEVLAGFEPLAPSHQPHNLAPIRELARARPDLPQVACFDTAFHRTAPLTAQLFGLPYDLFDAGVRRYGFHGLSYQYVVQALNELDSMAAAGRLVIAHLGSGCSLAAIRDRRSVASTMGFTALDGLPMGTRCGQMDPGVLFYLMRERGMTVDQVEDLLYNRAGLKGLSGISNDMRDLLNSDQPGAKIAVDYFVYRIGRELGSLVAALGGLDALVFTAGVGEHADGIRTRVCWDAAWLRVAVDEAANVRGDRRISPSGQVPSVWVIPTDEELMIARHTATLLPTLATHLVRR